MARKIGRVENYTTSCLVLIFCNLLWVLIGIWTLWGLPGVLLTGVALNSLISHWERQRST